MKKVNAAAMLLALASISLVGSSQAGTASGSFCAGLGGSHSSLLFGTVGVANGGGSTIPVSCTVPTDNNDLGSWIRFELRGYDNSTSGSFSCTPYVYDYNGAQVTSGPPKSGPSGTGAVSLNWWVQVPSGEQTYTNMYSIQCQLPNSQSTIYTARAY